MRCPTHVCTAALFLAALCSMPAAAHAYGLAGAGGKVGFTDPENHDGTVLVGGHLEFEQRGERLHLMPNLMYWKSDRLSDVNPNFDVYYHFNRPGEVTPYVGGGLGLNVQNNARTDESRTDLGANLIGGVRFPNGTNHYFVEGRYTASDVPQVALVGGVTFHAR